MTAINDALTQMVTLIKTLSMTDPPDGRVWRHPGESASISTETFPFAVVSKLNVEPGEWNAASFGVGKHDWKILVAVYLAEGPVVVTNADDITVAALANAHEWYEALADLLFENMTLAGTVQIIGDGEGQLYEYVTDNILWDGRQFYGHLFVIPVVQEVIQGVSA